jgi:hypothetical protein
MDDEREPVPSGKPKSYSPVPIALGVIAIVLIALGVMYSTRSTQDDEATSRCAGSSSANECAECCGQTDNMSAYSQVAHSCTCVIRRP